MFRPFKEMSFRWLRDKDRNHAQSMFRRIAAGETALTYGQDAVYQDCRAAEDYHRSVLREIKDEMVSRGMIRNI